MKSNLFIFITLKIHPCMIGRKLDPGFLLDRYVSYLRVHTAQENQTIVTVYKMQQVDSVLYVTKLNHKIINSRMLPLEEDVSG
jgi:hypothetical protein